MFRHPEPSMANGHITFQIQLFPKTIHRIYMYNSFWIIFGETCRWELPLNLDAYMI